MKIRETFFTSPSPRPPKDNWRQTHEIKSGSLDILADDGRELFTIELIRNGEVHIEVGPQCKHNGKKLKNKFLIRTMGKYIISLRREEDT